MAIRAYPWASLPRVPKATVQALGRARERLDGVDPSRVAGALSTLIGAEVAVEVVELGIGRPRERFARVSLDCGDARVTIGASPELATTLLARVLGRPFALFRRDAELDPALSGALAALAVEVATRVAREPVSLAVPASDDGALRVDLKITIDGQPYAACVLVVTEPSAAGGLRPNAPRLTELGRTELALPLVVAVSLATREELARLAPGSAWLPGEGCFVDAHRVGRGVLAAPASERGVWVDLRPGGKLVVRGESAELEPDPPDARDEARRTPAPDKSSLAEATLAAPVVVRVELGAVRMPAADWARLAPGDVIEPGAHFDEPVVLRVAGRAIASGVLVNVDGELGVRVREPIRIEQPAP